MAIATTRKAQALLVYLLLWLGQSVSASPIPYAFSYDFDSSSPITGTLWGELQADGNTIAVSDFEADYFAVFVNIELEPWDLGFEQLASLDGTTVHLSGLSTMPMYLTLFGFRLHSDGGAGVEGFDLPSGGSFTQVAETFDPGRWEIAALNTVPVSAPSSLLLTLLVFLLCAGSRLRHLLNR